MMDTITPIIIIILMFFHQYFLDTRADVFWNESAWSRGHALKKVKDNVKMEVT